MANSFTTGEKEVLGSIDSIGSSPEVIVRGGKLLDISINFSAETFIGSIELQRRTKTGVGNVSIWSTIETYTGDTEKVAESAINKRYRLNCTIAGSGTANIQLATDQID